MSNPTYIFSAEIAKDLKPIWKYLADNSVEERMTFDSGMMRVAGLDPSHIKILYLECPVDNKESIYYYLKFADLFKVIEKLKEYSIEVDAKEKKIIIRFQNGKRVRTLSLRFTTEPEGYEPFVLVMPEITTTFVIPFDFVIEALQDAQFYSEVIDISINKKKDLLTFSSEGSLGDSQYEIEADELVEHSYKEDLHSSFSISQLLGMKAIFTKPKALTLQDHPIMFEETMKSGIHMRLALAMRVEEADSASASPLEE